MPQQFTCKLLATRTPAGLQRIQYTYLGDDSVELFIFRSPELILPPDRDLTDDEARQWEDAVMSRPGVSRIYERVTDLASVVQVHRTYEDAIPPGAVSTELLWCINDGNGSRTIGVVVTNNWSRPIPEFSLSFDYVNETPQPAAVGDIQVHDIRGSDAAFHRLDPMRKGDLWPSQAARFVLDEVVMPSLLSRTVALSPERYWISLRTAGQEFDRIPGVAVGAFLESE